MKFYGLDFRKFLFSLSPGKRKKIRADLEILQAQKGSDTTFPLGKPYPIFAEESEEGGTMRGHYFHQDLYVARKLFSANPDRHLDIGSRTDGFVAHVAAYREIEVMDIRDIKSKVKNIKFRQADLMQLPDDLVSQFDSISSLHVIEHFGLGRYGDPIDYFGHLKAIKNIWTMLKPDGTFYFSTPIGPQRIEFNAHRVFAVQYLLDTLSPMFNIHSFSYVDDAGDLFEEVELTSDRISDNFGCTYGCGIFVLSKKQ